MVGCHSGQDRAYAPQTRQTGVRDAGSVTSVGGYLSYDWPALQGNEWRRSQWIAASFSTHPLPKYQGRFRRIGVSLSTHRMLNQLCCSHAVARRSGRGCINPVPDRMTPARPRVRVARSAGDGLPAASGVRRVPAHLHARKTLPLRTGCPMRPDSAPLAGPLPGQ